MSGDLICLRPQGLYCPPGDFYIDPWQPVERAVITHGHGDHARPGHAAYLATASAAPVLLRRLGDIRLQTVRYGERVALGDVELSLHPAGHVLGSAQVRVEHRGQVWVVSGDYKLDADPTCVPFEPLRCNAFISESTFGLPIYRWPPADLVFGEINEWWGNNAASDRVSVLFCYAFGKAQRILTGIDSSIGPLLVHGAVEPLNAAYREAGVALPAVRRVGDAARSELRGALVLAPPSAAGSLWMRRFGDYSDAFASGWMQLRGTRRRRALDRGFVLSDHADWPGLMRAIAATGAERVIVTHGTTGPMVRWLSEQGLDASAFATEFGDDRLDDVLHAADGSADA